CAMINCRQWNAHSIEAIGTRSRQEHDKALAQAAGGHTDASSRCQSYPNTAWRHLATRRHASQSTSAGATRSDASDHPTLPLGHNFCLPHTSLCQPWMLLELSQHRLSKKVAALPRPVAWHAHAYLICPPNTPNLSHKC